MTDPAPQKSIITKNPSVAALLAVVVILASLFSLNAYLKSQQSKEVTVESLPRWKKVEAAVQKKWGKTIAELPEEKLVVITPHNDNILREFQSAFEGYCALQHGKRVSIIWRGDPLGGSNAILKHLQESHRNQHKLGIDVVFGGGSYVFEQLAAEGMLAPLTLDAEALTNIPPRLADVPLYDNRQYWCGNVLSDFGIIYNKAIIQKLGMREPATWADLGAKDYFDQIVFANPATSGSAATVFDLIVRDSENWQQGWAQLIPILANAKKFSDSSSAAADAVLLGEAVASTCVGFYGTARRDIAPERIGYLSPTGQTIYTPDPIAVLNEAPHHVMANRFVNFILSPEGQALWGLPAGHANGPYLNSLYRIPIRKDFYNTYAGDLPPWLANPYANMTQTNGIQMDQAARYKVLIALIQAAAIDNFELMHQARRNILENGGDMAKWVQLPKDVDSHDKFAQIADRLEDPKSAQAILDDWRQFFKDKYESMIR